MSTLQLEETLRGGALYRNRNLDLTLETAEDLSEYQYRPVYIDADGTAIASGTTFAGILQNKGEDGVAHIRYAGVSRILLGELAGGSGTIDAGQRLILHPTYGYAVPWTAAGSTKESVLVKVTHIETGAGVTGIAASVLVRAFFSSAASPGTIINLDLWQTFKSEINPGDSPGWYEVGVNDGAISELDVPHALDITMPSNPEYIVTPSSYSWRPRPVLGSRLTWSTVTIILGESLEAGVTDDYVLCRLFPQIF